MLNNLYKIMNKKLFTLFVVPVTGFDTFYLKKRLE